MSLAASAWAAYYVAAGMAKRGEPGGWDVVAKIHADAWFNEVEIEARETALDLGPKWHGLSTVKAWGVPNPLDLRACFRKAKKADH